jgi:hypothetical protein
MPVHLLPFLWKLVKSKREGKFCLIFFDDINTKTMGVTSRSLLIN